jgi:hypothetical protein
MNAKYKKSLKLVTLLITSLIIATVAADTYSELFMYGSDITIGTAKVTFTAGDDTGTISSGITSAGTEVTFDTMPLIEPGETRIYNEAVNITNGATGPKTITIDYVSVTGDFETDFDYVNITMIDADNNTKGNSIEIISGGADVTTTGGESMTNGEVWAVRWIIKAKTDAVTDNKFSITLKVTVA